MNPSTCNDTSSSLQLFYLRLCSVSLVPPLRPCFSVVLQNPAKCQLVSLITCDLGVMLEITGGVSATAFAFIFPAACYLKLSSDKRTPWYDRTKLPAVACAGFGSLVMIISLVFALGKSYTREGGARICM